MEEQRAAETPLPASEVRENKSSGALAPRRLADGRGRAVPVPVNTAPCRHR